MNGINPLTEQEKIYTPPKKEEEEKTAESGSSSATKEASTSSSDSKTSSPAEASSRSTSAKTAENLSTTEKITATIPGYQEASSPEQHQENTQLILSRLSQQIEDSKEKLGTERTEYPGASTELSSNPKIAMSQIAAQERETKEQANTEAQTKALEQKETIYGLAKDLADRGLYQEADEILGRHILGQSPNETIKALDSAREAAEEQKSVDAIEETREHADSLIKKERGHNQSSTENRKILNEANHHATARSREAQRNPTKQNKNIADGAIDRANQKRKILADHNTSPEAAARHDEILKTQVSISEAEKLKTSEDYEGATKVAQGESYQRQEEFDASSLELGDTKERTAYVELPEESRASLNHKDAIDEHVAMQQEKLQALQDEARTLRTNHGHYANTGEERAQILEREASIQEQVVEQTRALEQTQQYQEHIAALIDQGKHDEIAKLKSGETKLETTVSYNSPQATSEAMQKPAQESVQELLTGGRERLATRQEKIDSAQTTLTKATQLKESLESEAATLKSRIEGYDNEAALLDFNNPNVSFSTSDYNRASNRLSAVTTSLENPKLEANLTSSKQTVTRLSSEQETESYRLSEAQALFDLGEVDKARAVLDGEKLEIQSEIHIAVDLDEYGVTDKELASFKLSDEEFEKQKLSPEQIQDLSLEEIQEKAQLMLKNQAFRELSQEDRQAKIAEIEAFKQKPQEEQDAILYRQAITDSVVQAQQTIKQLQERQKQLLEQKDDTNLAQTQEQITANQNLISEYTRALTDFQQLQTELTRLAEQGNFEEINQYQKGEKSLQVTRSYSDPDSIQDALQEEIKLTTEESLKEIEIISQLLDDKVDSLEQFKKTMLDGAITDINEFLKLNPVIAATLNGFDLLADFESDILKDVTTQAELARTTDLVIDSIKDSKPEIEQLLKEGKVDEARQKIKDLFTFSDNEYKSRNQTIQEYLNAQQGELERNIDSVLETGRKVGIMAVTTGVTIATAGTGTAVMLPLIAGTGAGTAFGFGSEVLLSQTDSNKSLGDGLSSATEKLPGDFLLALQSAGSTVAALRVAGGLQRLAALGPQSKFATTMATALSKMSPASQNILIGGAAGGSSAGVSMFKDSIEVGFQRAEIANQIKEANPNASPEELQKVTDQAYKENGLDMQTLLKRNYYTLISGMASGGLGRYAGGLSKTTSFDSNLSKMALAAAEETANVAIASAELLAQGIDPNSEAFATMLYTNVAQAGLTKLSSKITDVKTDSEARPLTPQEYHSRHATDTPNTGKVSEAHVKQLQKESGLSEQTISSSKIRTVDIVVEGVNHGQGIEIPVRDKNGNFVDTQIRLDDATIESLNKQYESTPKNEKPAIFGGENKVAKYHYSSGVRKPHYSSDFNAKDTSQDVFVTEGTKKALLLEQEGQTAIGIAGANSFYSDGKLLGLENSELKGRKVFITLDGDSNSNPDVKIDQYELYKALQEKGADPYIIDLPVNPNNPKSSGIDDLAASKESGTNKDVIEALKESAFKPRHPDFDLDRAKKAKEIAKSEASKKQMTSLVPRTPAEPKGFDTLHDPATRAKNITELENNLKNLGADPELLTKVAELRNLPENTPAEIVDSKIQELKDAHSALYSKKYIETMRDALQSLDRDKAQITALDTSLQSDLRNLSEQLTRADQLPKGEQKQKALEEIQQLREAMAIKAKELYEIQTASSSQFKEFSSVYSQGLENISFQPKNSAEAQKLLTEIERSTSSIGHQKILTESTLTALFQKKDNGDFKITNNSLVKADKKTGQYTPKTKALSDLAQNGKRASNVIQDLKNSKEYLSRQEKLATTQSSELEGINSRQDLSPEQKQELIKLKNLSLVEEYSKLHAMTNEQKSQMLKDLDIITKIQDHPSLPLSDTNRRERITQELAQEGINYDQASEAFIDTLSSLLKTNPNLNIKNYIEDTAGIWGKEENIKASRVLGFITEAGIVQNLINNPSFHVKAVGDYIVGDKPDLYTSDGEKVSELISSIDFDSADSVKQAIANNPDLQKLIDPAQVDSYFQKGIIPIKISGGPQAFSINIATGKIQTNNPNGPVDLAYSMAQSQEGGQFKPIEVDIIATRKDPVTGEDQNLVISIKTKIDVFLEHNSVNSQRSWDNPQETNLVSSAGKEMLQVEREILVARANNAQAALMTDIAQITGTDGKIDTNSPIYVEMVKTLDYLQGKYGNSSGDHPLIIIDKKGIDITRYFR